MSELRNMKWEMFAKLRAAGATQSESYARAYNKTPSLGTANSGNRLEQRPLVTKRIEELRPQSEATGSADLDPEFVIQSLLKNLSKAADSGKFSSANRTLELLGKFQGMFNESRRDSRMVDPLDGMDEQQLVKFVRRTLTDLGTGTLKKLGFIAIEPASAQRDEAVRFFREKLHAIDPDITVFDPQEVQAKPAEDDGTANAPLH